MVSCYCSGSRKQKAHPARGGVSGNMLGTQKYSIWLKHRLHTPLHENTAAASKTISCITLLAFQPARGITKKCPSTGHTTRKQSLARAPSIEPTFGTIETLPGWVVNARPPPLSFPRPLDPSPPPPPPSVPQACPVVLERTRDREKLRTVTSKQTKTRALFLAHCNDQFCCAASGGSQPKTCDPRGLLSHAVCSSCTHLRTKASVKNCPFFFFGIVVRLSSIR